MILPDYQIRTLAQDGMIEPFESEQVRHRDGERVISYGTSSYGYDIRCSDSFLIFTNVNEHIVDPKNFNNQMVEHQGASCIIPPNSFVLAHSCEYIRMPGDVIAVCLGKSTYARASLVVNVTPLEPGWEGFITMELSNTSPLPLRVYANEGIAQLLFLKGDACEVDYRARGGRYQFQQGITTAKV